jgi:peptidoglycan/xylan/chitin deacetylase (PgdA/CDA1 family)
MEIRIAQARSAAVVTLLALLTPAWGQEPLTEITKWQDGKDACISITYDDSSINQFRVAIPLMNERGLPGTFFIITGDIDGSKYQPAFIGRPIMDIIRESEKTPTGKENMLERAAMLNYLSAVLHAPELKGFRAQSMQRPIARGDVAAFAAIVDPLLARLRQSGATYSNGPLKTGPPLREPGDTSADWPGDRRYHLTWDEMRRHMAEGHEMANHTITHALLPVMDEANIAYELDQSKKEMLEQLGPKSQFSVEAPFGIDDPRVKDTVASRFPITRNWVLDDFMTGILRGSRSDPTTSTKEYVQWQRGPLAATPLAEMKGWVDTSLDHGIWLVLVIHGIEGIGWEALTTENLRSYFDYVVARKSRLWVATYQDAAKYARERHASVVAAKAAGDRIEVTVTHSLDKELYDLPLTAKTRLPADWKLAHFQQGSDSRWVPVHHEGDSTYVLYRIAPNGPPAVIEKAAN